MTKQTLPFEIPDVKHGFAEVKGLLRTADEAIILEFDERDAFLGIIKSEVQERTIPFSEIQSLEFKKKFFTTKIVITGRSMRSLEGIPGVEQARCTLKIKKKDRPEAERMISSLRVALSEYRLREMEE